MAKRSSKKNVGKSVKKVVSFTLDVDIVKWLGRQKGSRSLAVNQILRKEMERPKGALTPLELISELSNLKRRLDSVENQVSLVSELGDNATDISESLPEGVPNEVREWVEFRLESNGYIRWKDDRLSWEALEVGDSRRSFSSYMKDCDLVYVRKGNKWILGV